MKNELSMQKVYLECVLLLLQLLLTGHELSLQHFYLELLLPDDVFTE